MVEQRAKAAADRVEVMQNIIKMGTTERSRTASVAAAMGDQWGNRKLPPVAEQLSLMGRRSVTGMPYYVHRRRRHNTSRQ